MDNCFWSLKTLSFRPYLLGHFSDQPQWYNITPQTYTITIPECNAVMNVFVVIDP